MAVRGIVMWLLVATIAACSTTNEPAGDPEIVIRVTAKKWDWVFEYPSGVHAHDLYLPANRIVALDLTSLDVTHVFAIPALHVKKQVVPGRTTRLKLRIDHHHYGTFELQCTAACGMTDGMARRAFVTDDAGYYEWISHVVDVTLPPIERGEAVYRKMCSGCHSVDGTKVVGASLRGVWGQTVTFADGTQAVVDAALVRGVLDTPARYVREGYPNAMPSFNGALSGEEIDALAAYIESLR